MADVFLILSCIVGFGILLIGGFYLLVYYQHPDDHNEAYFPKFVVIAGFVIAGATVLLLPLDVANREGYAGCAGYDTRLCGGLPVKFLWTIMFWLIPIWMFLMIPFAIFFYESDDGQLMAGTAYNPNPVKKSRCREALFYQTFVVVLMAIFFAVMYVLFSETEIPVQGYTHLSTTSDDGNTVTEAGFGAIRSTDLEIEQKFINETLNETLTFSAWQLADMITQDGAWVASVTKKEQVDEITLQVHMGTFFAGVMAWLGWWLFAVFGGIGLAAVPLDLILAYTHRPRRMDAVEFAEIQMSLRDRTNELVDIGELLKIEREQKAQAGVATGAWSFDSEVRKAAREERQAILGFKQAVFLLEEDIEHFSAAKDQQNYNPLIPYFMLLLGCCAIVISVFWFIHIIIYVFPDPPFAPFLNNYFAFFDSWFPLFGVLSVAIFTFYLLLAAVKGAFKFGLRFLFFHIHPMKVGKTYMSSFMFNIALVLMCALPVVQFCQEAFADYTSFADIRQLFGVQIQYLKFFSIFWTQQIFVYIFFGVSVLTAIFLARQPNDQSASGQALRDRLHTT